MTESVLPPRAALAAAAGYVALTLAYTWPLAFHLSSAVPHDRGDPLLVAWVLWWSTKAVPLTSAWWNAPAFFPSTGVLAFSEHFLGLAPIAAPVIRLSHDPLLAYNVAFLASYVLSGLGGYFLGFVLTGRRSAAFLAGAAFAFAPYRLSHLQHLQLLSSYWMPVALAALHLYLRDRRPRWAWLFAAAWLLQALACGYYFFFLSVFVALWLLWFARRAGWRALVTLGLAWTSAAVLLLPILFGYRAIHSQYGFHRSEVEMVRYSADIAGLLAASPDSLLWRGLHSVAGEESALFPGVTILLLCAAALWGVRSPDRPKRCQIADSANSSGTPRANRRPDPDFAQSADLTPFYAGAAVVMGLLALGPQPRLFGRPLGIPGPYAALMWLPGFDEMRVPARLWMLSILALSAVAAIAIARIQSRTARTWVATAATVGCLLDGWPASFPLVAAPDPRVTTNAAAVRLGLPLGGNETETMYGAIPQARPVFNGYSGYEAPPHPALRDLLERHDPRIIARLAASVPIEILVERALDPQGEWRRYVEGLPGMRPGDASPTWTSYVIGPTGAAAPPPAAGTRLRVRSITASVNQHDIGAVLDGDLETRWNAASQRGGETLEVDLGSTERVSALELCLGQYASQYPRALTIETSADDLTWSPIYAGGTALQTYDAAVRDPRAIPITFPIARDGVRFIRLRQTANAPQMAWTIVELRVLQ